MNDEAKILEFEFREEFKSWLMKNHSCSDGVWILFTNGSKSFTAHDALEEALCYGWIDGVIKSIDDTKYKKYFSQRKDKTNWSEKNRSLFKILKDQGRMTEFGIEAFQYESDDKQFNSKDDIHLTNIATLAEALRNHAYIFEAFEKTAVSRKKQLAGFYCEAKTEDTRCKRLLKIIEAIRSNNKGMLY